VSEFDFGPGLRIEERIDTAEHNGIEARWEFGRWMLSHVPEGRVKLPTGFLDRLREATGQSRAELKNRRQFAEQFPTRAALAHALANCSSWYQIVNEVLGRRQLPERSDEQRSCADCGATEGELGQLRDPRHVLYDGCWRPLGPPPVSLDRNTYCRECAERRWAALSEEEREWRQFGGPPEVRADRFIEALAELGDYYGPGTGYAAGLRELRGRFEAIGVAGLLRRYPELRAAIEPAAEIAQEALALLDCMTGADEQDAAEPSALVAALSMNGGSAA
jgi:hypothetical protein